MTSRTWLTSAELHDLREALHRPWAPARPEDEVRRALSWFPDEPLIHWFLRGDGGGDELGRALSLDEAHSWRKQLLLRDLPAPLSSADRFLPLVRCPAGFLIYDGKARGVVLRRKEHPERYPAALETPLTLDVLLGEYDEPAPRHQPAWEDEEDDEEPDAEAPEELSVDEHLARINPGEGPRLPQAEVARRLAAVCADEELASWFAHLGAQTRELLGDLKAFSLEDAFVQRDVFEEGAAAGLQAQLHHLQWMPLIELPGRHAAVFWRRRGVRLHVLSEGKWQVAPWSRSVPLEVFIAALSQWSGAPLPHGEDEGLIGEHLWNVADVWDEDTPEHAVVPATLAGFSEPMQGALEAWFSEVPVRPFADAGERPRLSEELEAGQSILPLIDGTDGVETCAVEGRGITLRWAQTRLPWAPSVTSWVSSLDDGARRRGMPGVSITRNMIGQYRVEVPMLPFELARRLEQLTAEAPWPIDPLELTIALGPEARVEVDRFKPCFVLDHAARASLVGQLDAHHEPELFVELLSATFVFKPLLG